METENIQESVAYFTFMTRYIQTMYMVLDTPVCVCVRAYVCVCACVCLCVCAHTFSLCTFTMCRESPWRPTLLTTLLPTMVGGVVCMWRGQTASDL